MCCDWAQLHETRQRSAIKKLSACPYTDSVTAELGNSRPKEPFFFLKPTSSYLANGGTVELPKGIDVHHEGKPWCT